MRHHHAVRGSLTVVAVLLGLGLMERLANGPSVALAAPQRSAGPDEGGGLLSAAEQRKTIIAELKRISAQLEALDARLKNGISVKVTDMPEIKLPAERSKETP